MNHELLIMHPIICKLGPFTIYSYGLMLAVAFLVCSVLARQEAKKQHVNPEVISNLGFIIFIAGIVGARFFYIIENIAYYLRNPREIIMLQLGGLSWFGGLISGIICGVIYLKKRKLGIYKIFDLIVPFAALGQAIGRIGCLFNGCCFGITLIPIQIYSSLILIFIFIALRLLQKRLHKEGQIFFAYLLLYSLKRFSVEFWRADNEIIFSGMSLFQIISIAIFCVAFIELVLIARLKK